MTNIFFCEYKTHRFFDFLAFCSNSFVAFLFIFNQIVSVKKFEPSKKKMYGKWDSDSIKLAISDMFLCDLSMALPAAIKSWSLFLPTSIHLFMFSMSFPWCLASDTNTILHSPASSFTSIIPPSGMMLEFSTKRVCPNSGSIFLNALVNFFFLYTCSVSKRQFRKFFLKLFHNKMRNLSDCHIMQFGFLTKYTNHTLGFFMLPCQFDWFFLAIS